MVRRLFNSCLLRPSDFRSSQESALEVIGAFNPGAVATDDGIVLLVRVAESARERRKGQTALPRWNPETKAVVLDWEDNSALESVDVRVVRRRSDGLTRLTFISHLRIVRSRDGRTIDSIDPVRIDPANENEEFGIEDPRITRIGSTFYITYVAVSRHGVATALASTKDFQSFQRHGIIFHPENKDVVLFPEKIGDRYYALHRPNAASKFCKPEMWIASSPDLIHWGDHRYLLGGSTAWNIGRIGAGTPPIRASNNWLEIFHGNNRREEDVGIGAYSAGLLLLDGDDPHRVLGVSGEIFVAETDYEIEGFVPRVVFPTGIVERDGSVLVYYGAADTVTGVVEFSMKEILESITRK